MILTRQISIDLSDNSTAPIIRLQQSCIGVNIEFFLNNGGKPFKIEDGMTALILAEKPDGTCVYNYCRTAESKVVYEVTSQTIATAGVVTGQLQIMRGHDVLYSPKFEIWVSGNLSAEIESKNEYSVITSKEDKSNKVTEIGENSTDTEYPSAKLVYDELLKKETLTNKTTDLTAESTDTQYPSAKLVYDELLKNEKLTNKTTDLTAESTDTQYPSARTVWTSILSRPYLSNDFPTAYNTMASFYRRYPIFIYYGETKNDAINGHVYQVYKTETGSKIIYSVKDLNVTTGGQGGVSPTVSVEEITDGHRVTITDVDGVKTFDVMNGEKGERGEQGEAFTYADFTTEQLASLKGSQGEKGEKGEKGDTGTDGYTPVRGTDYWTEADIATIKSYVDDAILGGAW